MMIMRLQVVNYWIYTFRLVLVQNNILIPRVQVQLKGHAGWRPLLWNQHTHPITQSDLVSPWSSQSSNSREQIPPWRMRHHLTRLTMVQGDDAPGLSAICISSGPTPDGFNFPLVLKTGEEWCRIITPSFTGFWPQINSLPAYICFFVAKLKPSCKGPKLCESSVPLN